MRITLLFAGILLLGAARVGVAQTASESTKQRLRSQYLQNDTAQAIITLYNRRQAGGASWMLSGLLAGTRAAISGGSSTTINGAVVDQQPANMGAIALVIAPVMGYGLGKNIHYSNAHLERVLTTYAAGEPLPRSLRRRLKPKFFNERLVKYKPVTSESVN